MSEISIFAFESAAVRTLDLNGEPWFVATDIAKILGYRDAPNMIRNLDDDEAATHIVSSRSDKSVEGVEQNREVTIISESGLYACILKSRRPEAKSFRKWVTSEVLPSIRKRGSYIVPGAEPVAQFVTSNLSHGADLAVAADRTFRGFLRSARAAGLALPAALRVANQQTVARTGMDMLSELDIDPDDAVVENAEAPPEDDSPLRLALEQWAVNVTPGELFSLVDIVAAALGISPRDHRIRQHTVKAGPILRRLGFTKRKMQHHGRLLNIWYFPA